MTAVKKYASGAGFLLLLPACSLFFSDEDPQCTSNAQCPPGTACDPGANLCRPTWEDAGAPADAAPVPDSKVVVADFPLSGSRDIDLLFVVDNSDSMLEEQDALAASFPRMIDVLETLQSGLPGVHIGVVTTDMGANDIIPRCSDSDDGAFQATPSADCPQGNAFSLDGTFLVDVTDDTQPDGRRRNYSGSLNDAFSCIAQVGVLGCGFEMPLEAMRRGLTNAPAGFLRPDAFLAVIFITDEDDCSTRDYTMFDTNDTAIDGPLGPLDSFRCFEFGVECAPDTARELGAKEACVPREASPYMYGVDQYVSFLMSLKADPLDVAVAGIVAPPEPVEVLFKDTLAGSKLSLAPSCTSSSGAAVPPVRLNAFLERFPDRNVSTPICNDDLDQVMTTIGANVAGYLGSPCLLGRVLDIDPLTAGTQQECQVFQVTTDAEVELPVCDDAANPEASTNLPCHRISADPETCGFADSQLRIDVHGTLLPAPDIRIRARCLVP